MLLSSSIFVVHQKKDRFRGFDDSRGVDFGVYSLIDRFWTVGYGFWQGVRVGVVPEGAVFECENRVGILLSWELVGC